MFPACSGIRDQGRRSASGGLTTGIHVVFRGLKFEPVAKSRSSGTQISDKRGRFETASDDMLFYKVSCLQYNHYYVKKFVLTFKLNLSNF